MNGDNNNSSQNDRVNEDAAKSLQNILNSVRTAVENEFAIQQMEYDEMYGVDSEEYERYQNKVGSWLKTNKLIDMVADLLPLSLMMDMASPNYQDPSPPPNIDPTVAPDPTAVQNASQQTPAESQNPWAQPQEAPTPGTPPESFPQQVAAVDSTNSPVSQTEIENPWAVTTEEPGNVQPASAWEAPPDVAATDQNATYQQFQTDSTQQAPQYPQNSPVESNNPWAVTEEETTAAQPAPVESQNPWAAPPAEASSPQPPQPSDPVQNQPPAQKLNPWGAPPAMPQQESVPVMPAMPAAPANQIALEQDSATAPQPQAPSPWGAPADPSAIATSPQNAAQEIAQAPPQPTHESPGWQAVSDGSLPAVQNDDTSSGKLDAIFPQSQQVESPQGSDVQSDSYMPSSAWMSSDPGMTSPSMPMPPPPPPIPAPTPEADSGSASESMSTDYQSGVSFDSIGDDQFTENSNDSYQSQEQSMPQPPAPPEVVPGMPSTPPNMPPAPPPMPPPPPPVPAPQPQDFQQGQAQEQPQTNPNTLASGAWAVPKNENEENKEEDPYKFDPTNAWG